MSVFKSILYSFLFNLNISSLKTSNLFFFLRLTYTKYMLSNTCTGLRNFTKLQKKFHFKLKTICFMLFNKQQQKFFPTFGTYTEIQPHIHIITFHCLLGGAEFQAIPPQANDLKNTKYITHMPKT